jgi:acetolactate synthase small subunit
MSKNASAPQVIKQMNKLVNVLQATDLTDSPAVSAKWCCCACAAPQEKRTAVLKGSGNLPRARGRFLR